MYCFVINKSCISIRENKKKRFFLFLLLHRKKCPAKIFLKKKIFSMNSPKTKMKIKNQLEDVTKMMSVNDITQRTEFQNLENFRDQIYYLYDESSKIARERNNKKLKLTQSDIAKLFGIGESTVYYHLDRFTKAKEGLIRENGRPFSLTDAQLKIITDWIEECTQKPKLIELNEFCKRNFEKDLDYRTISILLKKMGYLPVTATPIEQARYEVSREAINAFYEKIDKFAEENQLPAFMCFNLDEEGHDEFVDATETKIIVKKEEALNDNKGSYYYPVPRKPNHFLVVSTLMETISGP